jgi:hypothetical protein
LARIGARLFGELIERFGTSGVVPEDLHWSRARFLRTAGHLVEAVAASEVLHAGGLRDPDSRKILATTRTGALLDLFDARGDRALLMLAERSLEIACALGPADEELRGLAPRPPLEARLRRYGNAQAMLARMRRDAAWRLDFPYRVRRLLASRAVRKAA